MEEAEILEVSEVHPRTSLNAESGATYIEFYVLEENFDMNDSLVCENDSQSWSKCWFLSKLVIFEHFVGLYNTYPPPLTKRSLHMLIST